MPPKKAAVAEEVISSSSAPLKDEKNVGGDSGKAPAARKVSAHPPTMVMLKEALKQLDTRKGVSSQAIRSYITEKYPSVDLVRLKYMTRKALAKGLESGVLVRPANSTATGAQGRFRLAVRGKAKESKLKTTENTDPNVGEVPKAAKAGAKKTKQIKDKEAGAEKKKPAPKKQKEEASEDPKPKKVQKEATASKVAPAKKPKAKKSAEGTSKEQSKLKVQKTSKAAKGEGTTQKKGAKVSKKPEGDDQGDAAPPPKITGKRGKKAAE